MGVYRNYPEHCAMLSFVIFKTGQRTHILSSQRAPAGQYMYDKTGLELQQR